MFRIGVTGYQFTPIGEWNDVDRTFIGYFKRLDRREDDTCTVRTLAD